MNIDQDLYTQSTGFDHNKSKLYIRFFILYNFKHNIFDLKKLDSFSFNCSLVILDDPSENLIRNV
jgi:hypothetical protein